MLEIDYLSECRKLLIELGHHRVRPAYVGLDRGRADQPRWRVGGDRTKSCPDVWAGLPIVYVESPEIPRNSTQDWLRRSSLR